MKISEEKIETDIGCVNTNPDESLQFLKELYFIMNKFGIHKIYRLTYEDNGELIDAHQSLKTTIGKSNISYMIFDTIKEKIPLIYYKIFYKTHILKYRKKLKQICDTYNVKAVHSTSYSLYQGIYISNGKLCIQNVNIIYKDGKINAIDKLYLDI